MKFRVQAGPFADAVGFAAQSLPSRPSVPVLCGVMLTVANGRLAVAGFDYEVSHQAEVDVHADADGAALVNGLRLASILHALPKGELVDVAATAAHLELACGPARFTLATMPEDDYPFLPEVNGCIGRVDGQAFAEAVARVVGSAGRDETLPMMTGVLLEFTGSTLALLATDRYRLAVREIGWKPASPAIRTRALVPARALAPIAEALASHGEVTITLDDGRYTNMIALAGGPFTATSRLLESAQYPPVRTLFVPHYEHTASVSPAVLADAVKRVALIAELDVPVRLSFTEDGITVESGGSAEDRASETVPATFTGTPMTIAFNPRYLLEGLQSMDAPAAVFSFNDAAKPVILTPVGAGGSVVEGFRYLIMPIRVGRG